MHLREYHPAENTKPRWETSVDELAEESPQGARWIDYWQLTASLILLLRLTWTNGIVPSFLSIISRLFIHFVDTHISVDAAKMSQQVNQKVLAKLPGECLLTFFLFCSDLIREKIKIDLVCPRPQSRKVSDCMNGLIASSTTEEAVLS